jgi:hypothetical protein
VQPVGNGELIGAVGTKPKASFSLFGGTSAPTAEQLAADVAALERLYHRRGYLRAKVAVAVAPTAGGWGAAALAAAERAVGRAEGDLRVRFAIEEGPRTRSRRSTSSSRARPPAAAPRPTSAQVRSGSASRSATPTCATPSTPPASGSRTGTGTSAGREPRSRSPSRSCRPTARPRW